MRGRGEGLAAVLAGGASGLLFAALVITGALEPVDVAIYDRLFALRGPRSVTTPIVIVAIDETSITELSTFPFPRAMHGALLDRLSMSGPLAVGIDLVFDTPSLRRAEDDEAFAAALLRAGNVVLAAAPTSEIVAGLRPYGLVDPHVPIPAIRAAARAVGTASHEPGPDGRQRHTAVPLRMRNQTLPAFDAALYQVARSAGLPAAPLPTTPRTLINFRGGPRTFPLFSYYRVVRGEIAPGAFRGKVVLVGATSPLMHDMFATPFAPTGDMPGIEIHANALETLIRGNAIAELPGVAAALAALAAGVALGVLVARASRLAAPTSLVALVAVAGGTYVLFAYLDAWFRAAAPMLAIALALVLSIGAMQTASGGWRRSPPGR